MGVHTDITKADVNDMLRDRGQFTIETISSKIDIAFQSFPELHFHDANLVLAGTILSLPGCPGGFTAWDIHAVFGPYQTPRMLHMWRIVAPIKTVIIHWADW
jgi:hypothetical protein